MTGQAPFSASSPTPLRIGVTCYPTVGGSGIIATEIGLGMARRGHQVHFICAERPRRLGAKVPNVTFHPVHARDYPVFPQVPYSLALASAMVRVSTEIGLDILHTHYAVPHATSAWMARQVLNSCALRADSGPQVVTSLHGTDITLVGADASYLPITRHSVAQSDLVTVPSAFLRDETYARLGLTPADTPVEIIPNFVDIDVYRPLERTRLIGPPVLVHASNFRPVKRVDAVVEIFAKVLANQPARLLLIGDGPDRPRVEAMLARRGLSHLTEMAGKLDHFEDRLRDCAVFLLPSSTESFGLAALEALASGVPVVASAVGGLPEVITDGHNGFLRPPHDINGMAERVGFLLKNEGLRQEMGQQARADVVARFSQSPMLDRYEAAYRRVLEPSACVADAVTAPG